MPFDAFLVNYQLTKGLQPAFESIIMRPMNAGRGTVMPTTLNFDAFESRLESCDAALTSLQETQGRMKGHIADCLESSTKVTIAARKAVEICETLVEKGPERHSLYIAAATSANRPANKRLSVAERVRLAHAALAAE